MQHLFQNTNLLQQLGETQPAVHAAPHGAIPELPLALRAYLQIPVANGHLAEFPTAQSQLPKELLVANNPNPAFAEPLQGNCDPFLALNAALFAAQLEITITGALQSEAPIVLHHYYHASPQAFVHPKIKIKINKGVKAKLIDFRQFIAGDATVVVNQHTQIELEQGAELLLYKMQNNLKGNLIDTYDVVQHQASRLEITTLNCNSHWVRNNLNITLAGVHADTSLRGLSVTKGTQFVDHHTQINHSVPHCTSNQLYKSILAGKSTGVFNGKILVQRDAQKTAAFQSSKNNVLSDDATINTKPQLEIYADDVKCSHGSTTGQIDQEALFYLRSRGLSEVSAKALLLQAFAAEVLQSIAEDHYREELLTELSQLLNNLVDNG